MAKKKRGGKRARNRLTKAELKAAGGDMKKAWAAKRRGGRKARKSRTHTKSPRRAARSVRRQKDTAKRGRRHTGRRAGLAPKAPARRRARKSGGRRRQTEKQRAASMRNLRKARRARKGSASAAPRRRRRKASASTAPRKRRKGGRRKAPRVSRRRRGVTVVRTASNRVTIKTRRPVRVSKAKGRTVKVAAESHRRRRRHHRRRHHHHARAAESYAMENPLSGGELALGLFTGALGFGLAEFTDRFIATHALTPGSTSGTFTDTPPTTGGAGGYQGLYNGTAVVAPMNLQRWGAGLGIGVTPIIIAAFVTAPAGRSALQMFGFGALIRTFGKGITDLVSQLTNSTAVGQQLYDNEIRAQMKQIQASGGTYTGPTPPYSGLDVAVPPAGSTNTTPTLGRALGQGRQCTGCGRPNPGVGACCGGCAKKQATQQAAPMPVQTTNNNPPQNFQPILPIPATNTTTGPVSTPPPPPPPPPSSTGLPPGSQTGAPSTGTVPPTTNVFANSPPTRVLNPYGGTSNAVTLRGTPRKGRFDWGYPDDAASE